MRDRDQYEWQETPKAAGLTVGGCIGAGLLAVFVFLMVFWS